MNNLLKKKELAQICLLLKFSIFAHPKIKFGGLDYNKLSIN